MAVSKRISFAVGFVAALFVGSASAQSALSDLYSQAALNRLCPEAQKTLTGTSKDAINVIHATTNSFAESSNGPYESTTLAHTYNGDSDESGNTVTAGNALQLTNHTHFTYQTEPHTGYEIPKAISCKLKDAEALNFHFGDPAIPVQQPCSVIVSQMVSDVYGNLTSWENRFLAFQQSNVIVDPDVVRAAGPLWLFGTEGFSSPTPFDPAVAYDLGDGTLHVRGISLAAVRGSEALPFVGPDKVGTYYCHLPTPNYIRELILGNLQACGPNSAVNGNCID